MNTIQIKSKKIPVNELNGFWDQGFRPFFFAAIIFSIISISYWALIYSNLVSPPTTSPATCLTEWHAHQMIFGYSLAVIAGFLLTAIPNWTNTKSIGGLKLISVFSFWLIARILFLTGDKLLIYATISDITFGMLLLYLCAAPIVTTKNWKQLGILAILSLLITSNIFFYLSSLAVIGFSSKTALYSGFYLIIGLILIISARVFPNFARIATELDYIKRESSSMRILAVIVFLLFYVNEILVHSDLTSVVFCGLLLAIYGKRLFHWHHFKLWKKPLIWSLYLSITFITLSFLLMALSYYSYVPKLIAIHCMALGGIGFATSGFMLRVCLGHSGKNIHFPPKQINTVLVLLIFAVFFRVFMPLINMAQYTRWVLISQILWIAAFFILLFVCFEDKDQKIKIQS